MERNELNCTGLACPIPIIKLNALVKLVDIGEIIEISADDPTFESDVKVWCKRMKCELLTVERDTVTKVVIKITNKDI